MCDENGAYQIAIRAVPGQAMSQKTVSCQGHFLRCAKKQLPCVSEEEKRVEFMELVKKLTVCVTKSDDVQITEQMANLAKQRNGLNGGICGATTLYPYTEVFLYLV